MHTPRSVGQLLGVLAALIALPAAAIVGGTSTSNFRPVDGGVQVTDNWVLTADHMLATYTVGSTYSNGLGSSVVAATYTAAGVGDLDNDLALLRLATPIAIDDLAVSADVIPAGKVDPAMAATIATGSNQVPRGYAFVELRELLSQFNGATVNWLLTFNDTYEAPYVEPGDSGGALFLGHVTDSVSPLLGITSAQLSNGAQTQFASAFVAAASYRSWIDATMRGDLADSQALHWVSAVPEPAALAQLLVGLGVLGVATRRRHRG